MNQEIKVRLHVAAFAIGIAAVASGVAAGEASAQSIAPPAGERDSRAERSATAAEVPWFERFTFSPGSPGNPGLDLKTAPGRAPAWATPNPRDGGGVATAGWGMTLNVGEAERLEGVLAPDPRKETALGAYFRFSPRLTVGGRVSLAEPKTPQSDGRGDRDEPRAGVKLESAFRF
jgi:hypothetical protein